jgi:Tol biopolymer transport system component
LGFLIYSKYSSKSPTVAVTPTATTTPAVDHTVSTTTPSVPASGIVQLSSDQVVSPALFYNGSGITYFDNQGNLYQAALQASGNGLILSGKKKLNIPVKPNIEKILWPQKGNDFIAQIADGSGKITWSYFNSTTGVYTDLPPQIESIDWMPNGTQIVYVWLDANNKASLSLANPDASNHKAIGDMWQTDNIIHVSPDGSQILFYETNNSSADNSINSVTLDGKVWKGLVKNGQNSGVLWSPDGQKFLFNKKDPSTQTYQLWVYNLTSGEAENLGLATTVEKAVWDSSSQAVYAAVPTSGTPGPNIVTADNFYRLDTSSLAKKQLSTDNSSSYDGRDLFLNSTGDKLFFKNAQNGGLYYIDLSAQAQP